MPEILDLIGKPFSEIKCWDLVREYEHRAGIHLPDYTDLMKDGKPDGRGYAEPVDVPEEGCICLYALQSSGIDHAGIYLGNNRLLHATEGSGVCIEKFSKYIPRLKGVYRCFTS